MNEILTEKQEALLNFIEQYQMANGGSPTIKEMKTYFGVNSDNSILKLLKALEEKGRIFKDEKHRGIKLLSNIKEKLNKPDFKLPIMGTVPAGTPVDEEEYIEDWLTIGEDMIYRNKESFLLRITGNSMIDAGIFEGDIVVVCRNLEAKVGDIVVALIDNQNTVKRYMIEDGHVYLKPENANYENIYPANELCLQGVVTGLIRYFKR